MLTLNVLFYWVWELGLRSRFVTLIVLVGSHNIPLQAVPVVATGFAATVRYRAFFSLEARSIGVYLPTLI